MVGVEPLRLMFRAREELWWLRRAVVGVKTPPSHVSNEGGVVVVKMGGVRISGEEGRVVVATPPSRVLSEGGVVVVKMGSGSHFGRGREQEIPLSRVSSEGGVVVAKKGSGGCETPPSRVSSEGGVVVVKMGGGSHFGRGREGGGSMEPLCLVFRAREGFVVCHINPGRT